MLTQESPQNGEFPAEVCVVLVLALVVLRLVEHAAVGVDEEPCETSFALRCGDEACETRELKED